MDSLGVGQLQAAFEQTPQISGNRYPRGYEPPPRPDVQRMIQVAKLRHEQQELYRAQVRRDMQAIRMESRGIFESDRPDAESGVMDEYESIALRAEFDLAHSWITGLNRRVMKPCRYPELEVETRKVQLAAEFIMKREDETYAERGDIEAIDAEVRSFLATGRLWISRTFNRYADVGESPFMRRYIDPQEVSWESSGGQIQRIYRVYMGTWQELMQAYGPSISLNWPELKRKAPDIDIESEAPVECVEYWDTWWRFVAVGNVPILGPVAHKYGEVPYTNAFSPRGEGFFGSIPAGMIDSMDAAETNRQAFAHRTPSYVSFLLRQHRQFEAQMNRMQHMGKYALDPDYVRYQSLEGGAQAIEEFDRQPGAHYRVPDTDDLQAVVITPEARAALQGLIEQQVEERTRITAPASAYGGQNDSQATQSAQRGQMVSGQHLWKPWARSLDAARGRDLSKGMRMIARVGDEALAGPDGTSRFYITVEKPKRGEAPVYELTDVDIQKAGPRVTVESDAQDPADWILKAQTFKLMREEGFTRRYLANKLFSFDFDQSAELEGFEERAMDQALEHPQFAEIASVPILLKNWMTEVKGDQDLSEFATSMLESWISGVTKRSMLEVQVKEGELQLQKLQIEKMLMELQQMQMMGPQAALPPGTPAAGDSAPAPDGPQALGGGQPGGQGRPEERMGAPTASQDFHRQGAQGGAPQPNLMGAAAQGGQG